MSVIRLSNGTLLIHSPCPLDAAVKADLDALGLVTAILAPGDYHYLNVEAFAAAFPRARIFVCPGVEKKAPALAHASLLSDVPDAAWSADLEQVLIRGSRFIREVAFFHRASQTLILVDAIENYGDKTPDGNWLLRFWWKYAFRMWNQPKPAPEYQLGWRDKAAAKESLERILAWDFSRIILAHGDLIEEAAPRVASEAWQAVLQRPQGYSPAQQTKLLQEFDRTCALVEEELVQTYGAARAQTMRTAVRYEYSALLPDVPRLAGHRARMLNAFLLITAQELAAYKGLKPLGLSAAETWQLCHRVLRLRVAAIPGWKRWALKQLMFSKPLRGVVARRAALKQRGCFGGFEIEYLDATDEAFDIGINYRGCGNYHFVMQHGGAEFAPYVCMSDIALSEALGWGLVRTQTLADGCDHCDFRMTRDGPTQISSKTPAVQRVVELIRAQEMGPAPAQQRGIHNA